MNKRIIGILGASANPMHDGHTKGALSALDLVPMLDEVWFMVTPHSPFKKPEDQAPIEHRLHLAHIEARLTGELGRKLKVSDFEVQLRRFGVQNATSIMLQHFTDSFPNLQPMWLMGADNLVELHTWGGRWQEIMERYPVGVIAREGYEQAALASEAAQTYWDQLRIGDTFACKPGTWTLLEGFKHSASSTSIRADLAAGKRPQHISDESLAYIEKYQLFQPEEVVAH